MFKNIRAKFLVGYSVITIAFTAILMSVVYLTERHQLAELALNNSMVLSGLHADLISSELLARVNVLEAVRAQVVQANGDVDQIVSELDTLMNLAHTRFLHVAYVDDEFNITDYKGVSESARDRPFVNDSRWFTQSYHITPAIIGRYTHIPIVSIGVRITNDDGEWTGTLLGALSLADIIQRLSSIQLGEGSYAWLTEEQGRVIAHPDESIVLNGNIFTADELGYSGLSAIGRTTLTHKTGYGEYFDTNTQEEKIVTFAKIDSVPWTLFITTKKDVVFSDIGSILARVLSVSLFLMLIFLLIGIKITNRVTRPITELTKQVKSSVDGHFQLVRPVQSEDEIGQLSRAFNETIGTLNEHTQNLEDKVEARTQELNTAYGVLQKTNQALKEKNVVLEEVASKDPLTELYNRRAFNVFSEQVMARAARHDVPASLILMDIDHFKDINDNYGHDVGDTVLYRIAHLLVRHTRKENIVCRWGGEEFIILVADADSDSARKVAEVLREKVASETFGPLSQVTVSCGVSAYRFGESLKDWVRRCDIALYEAKASGKNCVCTGD